MPEYLAPGVYVEETSFRAKSIEGVSTSTTGLVGPTRKGPLEGIPELITSFGDFERIYGGLANLDLGGTSRINYLAHAVRNYFNEGGSRLYVSRVFLANQGEDSKAAVDIIADQVKFISRYPGDAGNGRLTVRQVATPATKSILENAPEGTLVRRGGNSPAVPAQIEGGLAPFSIPNDGVLRLVVGGINVDITFHGDPAEVFGTVALSDPVNLDDENTTLELTIDGRVQTVSLPTGSTPRDQFISILNQAIRRGYARLANDGEGEGGEPANRLVIGSDRQGTQATVTVTANSELGIAADTTVTGNDNVENNVGDLSRVTPSEIDALLQEGNRPEANRARASLSASGRLVLTTVATGENATLAIADPGDNSVHEQLGLEVGGEAAQGTPGTAVIYYIKQGTNYQDSSDTPETLDLSSLQIGEAEILTLTVNAAEKLTSEQVREEEKYGNEMTYEEMGFDKNHPRWVGNVLKAKPDRRLDDLQNLYAVEIGDNVNGFQLRAGLFPSSTENSFTLSGGNDGSVPIQSTYEAALLELEKLEDISIVAAPGYSTYQDYQGIQGALITHAERRRAYRIAVLDSRSELTPTTVLQERSQIDSKYAAFYYPWVVVSNPLFRPGYENIPREIKLPPSAFICGIYARNDVERGVYKAPANEVMRGALRFEYPVNFAEQQTLNPFGVNCLRFFPGRGYRVWGARTASSDPEWKYVSIRRYFIYLEQSIDRGTQWAVFEPNGERLWANVRSTISDFLYNEWVSGALLGSSTQEAFFVRCDRSTMTQNDLDNGRLICLIGVAALKPAEFVIFRIGQKTADARS